MSPIAVPASYFDVDGTLVRTNLLHPTLFYLLNQQTPLRSLGKLARAAFRAPRMAVAELQDRRLFNELLFSAYEGMSRGPASPPRGRGVRHGHQARPVPQREGPRGAQPRDQGHDVILVSGALDFLMEPPREAPRRHRASSRTASSSPAGSRPGSSLRPVVAGPEKAKLLRDHARAHGHDLDECFAYSDSYSDVPMLSVVGHPAAVNPDYRLAQLASAHGWPVLESGAPVMMNRFLESLRSQSVAPAARPAQPARRDARPQERAADDLLGRSLDRRRHARRHARRLPAPAARAAEGRRRRDPLRAQPPLRDRPAPREAPPRHEGRHRRRRHLAPAPPDARPRRARAGAHDRPRAPRRSRRRRRRDHHRHLAPSPHDGPRGPAHRRLPDLRRVLAQPPLQPRRRRPEGDEGGRHDRSGRGRGAQSQGGRERSRHLREPEPRPDGRRAQVGHRRPLRLQEPPLPPRAAHDAAVPQLHGSGRRASCRRA